MEIASSRTIKSGQDGAHLGRHKDIPKVTFKLLSPVNLGSYIRHIVLPSLFRISIAPIV